MRSAKPKKDQPSGIGSTTTPPVSISSANTGNDPGLRTIFPPLWGHYPGRQVIFQTGIESTEVFGVPTITVGSLPSPTWKLVQNEKGALNRAPWKSAVLSSNGAKIHVLYTVGGTTKQSIVHAYSTNGGDTWTRQIALSSHDLIPASGFAFDADTDGAKLFLIWKEASGTTHLVKRKETSSDSITWGTESTLDTLSFDNAGVNSPETLTPHVGIWVSGTDRHYVWNYGDDGVSHTTYCRYSLNEGTFETVYSFNPDTSGSIDSPAVVADSAGNPWAWWFFVDITNNQYRWEYSKKSGGTWAAKTAIFSSTSTESFGGGDHAINISVLPVGNSELYAAYDYIPMSGGVPTGPTRIRERFYNGTSWNNGQQIALPSVGSEASMPALASGTVRIAYREFPSDFWTSQESGWGSQGAQRHILSTLDGGSLTSGSVFGPWWSIYPRRLTADGQHVGAFREDLANGSFKVWIAKIPKGY